MIKRLLTIGACFTISAAAVAAHMALYGTECDPYRTPCGSRLLAAATIIPILAASPLAVSEWLTPRHRGTLRRYMGRVSTEEPTEDETEKETIAKL